MADKKQVVFAVSVAVITIGGIFAFVSDAVSSFKENKPKIVNFDEMKAQKDELMGTVEKEFGGDLFTDYPDILTDNNALNNFETVGHIVNVVDGDTLCIDIDDIHGDEDDGTTVNLIGVAAEETVGDNKVRDLLAGKAKNGDLVYIEYGAKENDNFGNTLAYVYLSNGTMIEEWLLSNGYAKVVSVDPNNKYDVHFRELSDEARAKKAGLWSE